MRLTASRSHVTCDARGRSDAHLLPHRCRRAPRGGPTLKASGGVDAPERPPRPSSPVVAGAKNDARFELGMASSTCRCDSHVALENSVGGCASPIGWFPLGVLTSLTRSRCSLPVPEWPRLRGRLKDYLPCRQRPARLVSPETWRYWNHGDPGRYRDTVRLRRRGETLPRARRAGCSSCPKKGSRASASPPLQLRERTSPRCRGCGEAIRAW